MIILFAGFLILTGMDMLFNLDLEKHRKVIFPWTKPIHGFIVKILDQHNF